MCLNYALDHIRHNYGKLASYFHRMNWIILNIKKNKKKKLKSINFREPDGPPLVGAALFVFLPKKKVKYASALMQLCLYTCESYWNLSKFLQKPFWNHVIWKRDLSFFKDLVNFLIHSIPRTFNSRFQNIYRLWRNRWRIKLRSRDLKMFEVFVETVLL